MQRAITAQQIYGEANRRIIPTPEAMFVESDSLKWKRKEYPQPKQLIHVQGLIICKVIGCSKLSYCLRVIVKIFTLSLPLSLKAILESLIFRNKMNGKSDSTKDFHFEIWLPISMSFVV